MTAERQQQAMRQQRSSVYIAPQRCANLKGDTSTRATQRRSWSFTASPLVPSTGQQSSSQAHKQRCVATTRTPASHVRAASRRQHWRLDRALGSVGDGETLLGLRDIIFTHCDRRPHLSGAVVCLPSIVVFVCLLCVWLLMFARFRFSRGETDWRVASFLCLLVCSSKAAAIHLQWEQRRPTDSLSDAARAAASHHHGQRGGGQASAGHRAEQRSPNQHPRRTKRAEHQQTTESQRFTLEPSVARRAIHQRIRC